MKIKYGFVYAALFISFFIFSYSAYSEQAKETSAVSEDALFDEINEEFKDANKVSDPFMLMNKAFFHFNDKFYYYILKPASKGYDYVMPDVLQKGIGNFFNNISAPVRIVNSVFQGKFQKGAEEFRGFVINSSIGLFGFLDPVKTDESKEDFGQTLAVYGVDNGFYIVLPFLGASTLRDLGGRVFDFLLNPLSYMEEAEIVFGMKSLDRLNATSLDPERYEDMMRSAIDPYELLKDGYLQMRAKKVKE